MDDSFCESFDEELIEAIARRRCVLYIGAGVSANSKNDCDKKPPTWKELIQKINDHFTNELSSVKPVIDKLLAKEDYLMAFEIILDKVDRNRFGNYIKKIFTQGKYHCSDVHKAIFNLDSKFVVTPNVDTIYETYAKHETQGTTLVKNYTDTDLCGFLRSNDYVIVHAHGSIESPHSMIFTESQYNSARVENERFYKLLEALILTHTFVFIGCGISDPDIKLILEDSNFKFPYAEPHYFITSKNSIDPSIQKALKKNRNLKLITYTNTRGEHEGLFPLLKNLNREVDNARTRIADENSW